MTRKTEITAIDYDRRCPEYCKNKKEKKQSPPIVSGWASENGLTREFICVSDGAC